MPELPITPTPAAPPTRVVVLDQDPSPDPVGATQLTDPLAPPWADPVSRVPKMFGGFFGRTVNGGQAGAAGVTGSSSTSILRFTGVGAEGGGFASIIPNGPVIGPGGPYPLANNIPIPVPMNGDFVLGQNAELTNQLNARFPGLRFLNGGGTFINLDDATFFYNYLGTVNTNGSFSRPAITANLPNPAGGGLVGRNLYFENGSALPEDRLYFFYNLLGTQQQGFSQNINRFVLGGEMTFADQRFSAELRIPFSGTENHDQIGNAAMSVDQLELGNIGLAGKAVLYRSSDFIATAGLGISLPTSRTSRLLFAGVPILEIQNRAVLIQPFVGFAYTPTDRSYTQAGLQVDFDPTGNPVRALNGKGGLSRIGKLNDQTFAFLNAAAGYWLYESDDTLTAVAGQIELDYFRSFGRQDVVQSGAFGVTDSRSSIDILNITPSAVFEFDYRTRLSVGVSLPLTDTRVFDWAVTVQLNYRY